jgi:serine/threonine protein kinase
MADLQPGDVFAGHRIEGLAGRGGMGVVYRATELRLDRTVALKLIAPALAGDPDFRARFLRESRAAASIEHPNVLPIYYAGEHGDELYIVMRYVDGQDLRTLVRAAGYLDGPRVAGIVAQVGAALDAAHERGLVHRDVKPANVLLAADDHAYLTDFGLAKDTQGSLLTRPGQTLGSVDYMAPEQIRSEEIGRATDVYALGCVMFECLAGKPPFADRQGMRVLWAHLQDEPPDPAAFRPELPPALPQALLRSLAKDPAARPASASQFAESLAQARRG